MNRAAPIGAIRSIPWRYQSVARASGNSEARLQSITQRTGGSYGLTKRTRSAMAKSATDRTNRSVRTPLNLRSSIPTARAVFRVSTS